MQYSVRFVVVGDDREPELDGPAPEVGPGGLPQLPTVGMALAVGLQALKSTVNHPSGKENTLAYWENSDNRIVLQ